MPNLDAKAVDLVEVVVGKVCERKQIAVPSRQQIDIVLYAVLEVNEIAKEAGAGRKTALKETASKALEQVKETATDPLCSFSVRAAWPGTEAYAYKISMDGHSVEAKTLKEGVVKLFEDVGISVETIKAYPDSYNRDLILMVMEGAKELEEVLK